MVCTTECQTTRTPALVGCRNFIVFTNVWMLCDPPLKIGFAERNEKKVSLCRRSIKWVIHIPHLEATPHIADACDKCQIYKIYEASDWAEQHHKRSTIFRITDGEIKTHFYANAIEVGKKWKWRKIGVSRCLHFIFRHCGRRTQDCRIIWALEQKKANFGRRWFAKKFVYLYWICLQCRIIKCIWMGRG